MVRIAPYLARSEISGGFTFKIDQVVRPVIEVTPDVDKCGE
jgi:hypothetical protein